MLLSLLAAVAISQSAAEFDAEAAFGARPFFGGVSASPDGNRIAAYIDTGERWGIGVYETTGEQGFSFFLDGSDKVTLPSYVWKRDDLLLIGVGRPAEAFGSVFTMVRLFGANPSTKEMTPLFKEKASKLPVLIQNQIVSILPEDEDHVLIAYRPKIRNAVSVFKVNVNETDNHKRVHHSHTADGWFLDFEGNVRGRVAIMNGKPQTVLAKPGGGWQNITRFIKSDETTFRILGFPLEPGIVYVASDHETDTQALYSFDIEAGDFKEQLFVHPTSDVYGIAQDTSDGRVIGVSYAEETGKIEWFEDNEIQSRMDKVKRILKKDEAYLVSLNMTQTAGVYAVSEGARPPSYALFNYDRDRIVTLPSQYPQLDDVELGITVPVSYTARDDLDIQAYVTLPPGFDSLADARDLPFVVMPHGGPTARDFSGFDWWAQYLAHKGFGVFQMNFRGSSGYGRDFREAGEREWGQAMQDDITDGTQWLIDKGHASPDKITIMGASYGGYAALMGAAKEPDLYVCSVSVNGVSDLPDMISYELGRGRSKKATRKIGRQWGDRRMLRENSPARRAEDITIPVLLVHGERDGVVPISQSEKMRDALEKVDRDVTFVELPKGSHYLNVDENRITFLRELNEFMGRCK
ncbi:MAG: S9 family peptidase [Pseudomonadota bacterium]